MITTGGSYALNYIWDTGTLSWIPQTAAGGGGGGAVTIANGADTNAGSTTDAAVTGDTAGTMSAKLRGINTTLSTGVAITPGAAASWTLSNVAASASSVTALAANASRKGAIFFNDSTSSAYLKLGTSASTTSFTYKMFAYQLVVLDLPIYQGTVAAIWDSATGNMRVSEGV